MTNNRAESIREELRTLAHELQQLDEARQSLLSRREALEATLRQCEEISQNDLRYAPTLHLSMHSSPDEKVRLFGRFFRGREDVFPRRFESAKTGKSGYQPACANEWKPGVCLKPRVKCAVCEARAFLPVTEAFLDAHLRGHLQGESADKDFTMGVYPLLMDETCYFLAVDFDKDSWQADASAYVETCGRFDVPAYLERSRSGNGGHVWIFFDGTLPAKTARQLGTFLLTETMERRPDLGFDSYDRFFPNQDTLPQGGFGNLIALPLQKRPREKGNSVFVDSATFQPWDDQWAALASFRRMPRVAAEKIVAEAELAGRVLGVRVVEAEDELERERPWEIAPSYSHPERPIEGPLPRALHLVLSDGIYIAKADMPPPLRNRLIRVAAFQNPEFYKAQAMRFPTWEKPRIVSCCRDFPNHIALPRGCLEEVLQLLKKNDIAAEIQDERVAGKRLAAKFVGKLRPQQKKAAEELLRFDMGVLCASTAFGKTVVAAWIIAKRKVSTLILVHRSQLLDQWIARLSTFLGMDAAEIGRIGSGKRQITGRVDVATIQSLYSKKVVDDIVADYGQLIVDECHHLSAQSFEAVASRSRAKYVLGLSATVARQDGHQPIIFMQCGPIRYKVDDRQQARERPFSHHVIVRRTGFALPESLMDRQDLKIYDLYRALAEDERRNSMITSDVLEALAQGRNPVVITERTDHLERLSAHLNPHVRHLVALRGGMGTRQRRDVDARLKEMPADEPRVLIATGKYLGEGYDDPRLDTLFLSLPVSWKGIIAQYAGRLHRLNDMKKEVLIYDYLDDSVPMLVKMFNRRQVGYRAIGYTVGTHGERELDFGSMREPQEKPHTGKSA